MKRTLALVFGFSLLALPVTAIEDEEEDDFDDEAAWEALERPISFEFKDTPLDQAIDFFRATAKANIVLHRAVQEKLGKTAVNLKLARVRVMHAVRVLAAAMGLEVKVMDGAVLLLRFPTVEPGDDAGRITLDLGRVEVELDIKRADLPPDMRNQVIHRAMEQLEFEAMEREHKMDKRRRQLEKEERLRERHEGAEGDEARPVQEGRAIDGDRKKNPAEAF